MSLEGRGYISKNDYKRKENHPDVTGMINIGGQEYKLAGWTKEKNGRKFVSLKVDTGQQQAPQPRPQPKPQPAQPQYQGLDDEIPF